MADYLTANPPPAGDDGREVELQTSATHVQWRYAGDVAWLDLIPLALITGQDGDDGLSAELQTTATHIQWRQAGGVWTDLIPLASLVGPEGPEGPQGPAGADSTVPGPEGPQGPANTLAIDTVTTLAAGAPATAEITGTAPNQALVLGIPMGLTGAASDWLKVGPGDPRTPATTAGQITGTEPNGCSYRSTDGGGVGGYLWVKRGGVWVCEVLDTGTRNIASLLDTTNWELDPTAGFLNLSRVNDEVRIAGRLRRLTPGSRVGPSSHFLLSALPVGFRRPSLHYTPFASSARSLSYIGVLSSESTIERPILSFPLGTPIWAVGDSVSFSGTYSVGSEPAPTTRPGTAV